MQTLACIDIEEKTAIMHPWLPDTCLGVCNSLKLGKPLRECMAGEAKKKQAYEQLIRKRTDRAHQKLAAAEEAQIQVDLRHSQLSWQQVTGSG